MLGLAGTGHSLLRWICRGALGLCVLAGSTPSHAADLHVAVAANFAGPMAQLAQRFHDKTGHTVHLTPGSSGKLAAQIRQNAPFDLFLAADETTPQRLETEGLVVPGTRRVYAIGRLVLWSRDATLVDAKGEVLQSARFQKLAIAHPDLAPYGRAAEETLEHLGLWQKLQDRVVRGENVQQAMQFAVTGAAQLAFVARAQVIGQQGSQWLVPVTLHTQIRQAAVVLTRSQERAAAQALLDFLRQPATVDLLRQAGYEAPPTD